MPSTDLALAPSNTTLASLVTRCLSTPACLYHLSSIVTRSRVTEWLRASRKREIIPIWVWLSYPHGAPPRWIQKNMEALARHAPPQHFRINVLNATSVRQYLTLPPEFGRLRSEVAASDLARLGLLALYGGLYLDADVLVASTLRPLLKLLDENEVVAYTTPGQDCRAGVFSSNFLATRPNTTLWLRAWDSLRTQLKSKCGGRRRNKICCYHQNGSADTVPHPVGPDRFCDAADCDDLGLDRVAVRALLGPP